MCICHASTCMAQPRESGSFPRWAASNGRIVVITCLCRCHQHRCFCWVGKYAIAQKWNEGEKIKANDRGHLLVFNQSATSSLPTVTRRFRLGETRGWQNEFLETLGPVLTQSVSCHRWMGSKRQNTTGYLNNLYLIRTLPRNKA